MNTAVHYLPLGAFAVLAVVQTGARAQTEPPVPAPWVASAPLPVEATGKSCADKWRDYQRSTECYIRFRSRHFVSPEAVQRCGPPVKEPTDCPRSP